MSKEYVVIFPQAYDAETLETHNKVLLVEKQKPEWQKGLFNLVGGKIEAGEGPIDAAIRELHEESGLVPIPHFDPFIAGTITGDFGVVYCVWLGVDANVKVQQGQDEVEHVAWYEWNELIDLQNKLIPNLKTIIPLMSCRVLGWNITDNYPNTNSDFKLEVSMPNGQFI